MTVGGQTSSATVDQILTDLAVILRNWAFQAKNLEAEFGTLAALEAAGYSAADAQAALNFINFMNNIAAVYYGTGTQPSASNFDAAFAPLWAGRLAMEHYCAACGKFREISRATYWCSDCTDKWYNNIIKT